MMKICSSCHVEKALTEFNGRKDRDSAITSACKVCLRQRDKLRYARNASTRIARQAIYKSTKAGKQVQKKANEKWYRSNAKKVAAHRAVNGAIRYKRLVAWPVCEIPECSRKPEAHHPNYDAPLSVVWLCRSCHAGAHKIR